MDLTILIKILQKEQALHDQLLKAKQSEQKYIATTNPSALLNNTETLIDLIKEIEIVEKQRQECMQQYADALGLEIPHPTLKDILEVISPANRVELEQCGDMLRQSVYELQHLNDANHLLLERAVEMFNDEIKHLAQPQESGVYTKKGKKDSSPVARAGLNLQA